MYGAVAVFYVGLFAALVWPVYPRFASIEPRVLGVPFSLVYVVVALLLSFAVLLGLYLWERDEHDSGDPAAARDPSERFDPGGRG
ncbi:MAG: hypothetical protein R3266_06565 [Gemmatimonadota bacterium]|nr:hypothetical protein [Gemmatimonadota bacterium]